MQTPWGECVTADNAWRDYPRPLLVRDQWRNLNGLWQYAITARASPTPQQWDGEILVPFCIESSLSGVARRLRPDQRLWYRRFVDLADDTPRTLMHFGAVDYHAALWINGGFVGAHRGGFTPFGFDISDFVRAGSNEIIVAVDDPTSDSQQPRGKQHHRPQGIWYTPVSGIWQTVWLEQVPRANHIAEVRVLPDVEAGAIDIEVLLARPTRATTLAAAITVRLADRIVATGLYPTDRRLRLVLDEVRLWTPASPTLYDVDVDLVAIEDPRAPAEATAALPRRPPRGAAERALFAAARRLPRASLDRVRSYFGMRRIVVAAHPRSGEPTLLLNGRAEFQLGTLDQGWWPDGLHTPPSDDAIVYELEYLKAAGFNTVRKHIKIEPARWYWHCDRLGLLVWQDMPSGFLPAQFVAPDDTEEALRDSTSSSEYEAELATMVRALRGHPSVVLWVLHNEGWGQFDSARLTAMIQGLDPSRPVNASSGWHDVGAGEVIDRHDYEAEPCAPPSDGRRARVIGEYGGVGWPRAGHLWDPTMRNWGYQTLHDEPAVRRAYERLTTSIGKAAREDGVCAAIYTQTSDVEGEVNGLLTYDRRCEKLPRAWLAALHARELPPTT